MTGRAPNDVDAADGDDDLDHDLAGDLAGAEVPRGGPRAARNAAVLVGVVLVLFIALLATRQSADQRVGRNPLIDKAMPRATGTTMDGSELDLDKFRGKWVVVNFFAAWCGPCIEEHPELIKFSEDHAVKGDAVVVSIAYNDQPSALKAFFARNGGTWPVIVSDNGRAAIDFGVTGVPESFVVAPNQVVVDHFYGVTQAELDAVIARYPDAAAPSGSSPSASLTSSTSSTSSTPTAPSGTAAR